MNIKMIRQVVAILILAAALLGPAVALAADPPDGQPAGGEQAGKKTKEKLSLLQLLQKGGFVMVPLALCSIAGLASSVERAISLQRRNVVPKDLLDGVKGKLGARANVKAAAAYCEEAACAGGRLVKAGLDKAGRGLEQVEKALEEAGAMEIDRMKRSMKVVGLVVTIAPLLGLVGTVYGMIEAFETTAASTAATGKAEQLANGIYEALVTTATGLTIAIPMMVVYYLLNAKIDSYIDDFTKLGEGYLEINPEGKHKATPKRAATKKTPAMEPVVA